MHDIPVRLRLGSVRWLLPRAGFAAWTLVILGLLFLGGPVEDAHGTTSPLVALVGVGLIVAVACVPWGRLPESATAALALLGIVVLVPLQVRSFPTWDRDYALLILLPLTWLAVKHSRRVLIAGLACATVVFWAPVLTDQEHPLLVVTLACVYSGLAALVGLLVQTLRNRTRAEAAVAALGHTDSLTGLPNRRAWDATLTARLVDFDQRGRGACIAMLDVDGFKIYNDDWGHIAGDRLLIDAAAAWSTTIGADGYLARLGGDEFALLIPDATAGDAEATIARLRAAMPASTGLSAGLAVWRPGETAETALERADRALYTVKRSRRERGRTVIETPESSHAGDPHWNWLVPVLLARRDVEAVFQPIVDLTSGRIVAHEALARPLGEAAMLSVDGMFRAAHRLGLANELDLLCQQAAVRDAKDLSSDVLLFINVGVGALVDPEGGIEHLLSALRWVRRDPRSVVLEINESVNELARFGDALAMYRAANFRFALDDVGEGHSTLEALAAVDPEYVKIARSLTLAAATRGGAGTISALVAFAAARGAVVIAEGIENDDELRPVRDLGVQLGQGYGLGAPARLRPLISSIAALQVAT